MENIKLLKHFGLFDTKAPRYTSYPPANQFKGGIGQRNQTQWLLKTAVDKPISVYVHIPFCRRLCWFCACRTQGTKTNAPLDAYIGSLTKELKAVSKLIKMMPPMARLHLGGGTPTLLNVQQMESLLKLIFTIFPITKNFEFSVEIDPTEASDDILTELQKWGVNRTSIGVQDFNPKVQKAIGRFQSYKQTQEVVTKIYNLGISNINLDLLYGLPHQTEDGLLKTIAKVICLDPDRIALYGYAHVPHVSKRQVMIDADALPSPKARYKMIKLASNKICASGYRKIGIDHFAKPSDNLFKALQAGRIHRNFQGYTDDPCDTLIGFGASAISKFPEGYSQNAVSTIAYTTRVGDTGIAGHRGYKMQDDDFKIARMIEMLMTDFTIDAREIDEQFPGGEKGEFYLDKILAEFPNVLKKENDQLSILPGYEELVRIIAGSLDIHSVAQAHHSSAI